MFSSAGAALSDRNRRGVLRGPSLTGAWRSPSILVAFRVWLTPGSHLNNGLQMATHLPEQSQWI